MGSPDREGDALHALLLDAARAEDLVDATVRPADALELDVGENGKEAVGVLDLRVVVRVVVAS